MSEDKPCYVGTAGWGIPRTHEEHFPTDGAVLTRYATIFAATEINSTFYRQHRPSTFERWHDNVPDDFRFSVKVPRTISHDMYLGEAADAVAAFAASLAGLGEKLGPLLMQLPPKAAFDPAATALFLDALRKRWHGSLAIEPRHASWFTRQADSLLDRCDVARVGADPARAEGALDPGGSRSLTYVRLHGSPRIYYDAYPNEFIHALAHRLAAAPKPVWCIFDNTASGAAAGDAMKMLEALR